LARVPADRSGYGRVVGIQGRSGAGATVTDKAHLVVGADGKHSMVGNAVGAASYRRLLLGSLVGRQVEIDRLLGVFAGIVPIPTYFSARNFLRLLGIRGVVRAAMVG
jgi:flavin-dependent dehydrogenase